MQFTESQGRWLNRLGFLAVVAYTCYLAMGTNVFGSTPWPKGCVDYTIIYDLSHEIVASKTYQFKHAYPPSAVALHFVLAQLPFAWSAAVFMALTIAATLACWWMLLQMLPDARRPMWLLAVVPAYLLAQYYILWDLRSQNCNLIVFATALAGIYCLHVRRPAAAGFWIALAFSLKLFSVFLLPYLLWRRQGKAFASAAAFIAVFWLLVPWGIFGSEGFGPVYQDWWRQMRDVGSEHADLAHPILISLHNAGHLMFDGDAGAIARLVQSFRALWLLLGLATLALAWRWRTTAADAYGPLVDVSLLLLAPAAVSPYLEVYHAVPYMISAYLLLAAAFDPERHWRWRTLAAAVILAHFALRPGMLPFQYRGIYVNVSLLATVAVTLLLASVKKPMASEQPAGEGLPSVARAA